MDEIAVGHKFCKCTAAVFHRVLDGNHVPSTVEYLALLLVSINDTQPCSSAVANR